MTSIEPEAFDRKPLIDAIKSTQLALEKLLLDTEQGKLERAILNSTDEHLVKLRQQIKERLGLLKALSLL